MVSDYPFDIFNFSFNSIPTYNVKFDNEVTTWLKFKVLIMDDEQVMDDALWENISLSFGQVS
jgi:hypothetical protein